MSPTALQPIQDWTAYYQILAERQGPERLRRLKARLYEKLEVINEEIDELEADKELFCIVEHPEYVPMLDAQVERLLAAGREASIQLEVVIELMHLTVRPT